MYIYMSIYTFTYINKVIYRFVMIILNIFRIIFKWIHFVGKSFGYCLPWFALF